MQISGSQILDCIDYENRSNLRAIQLYFRVLTKIIQLLICAELSANPIVRHDNYDMTEVLLTASLCVRTGLYMSVLRGTLLTLSTFINAFCGDKSVKC